MFAAVETPTDKPDVPSARRTETQVTQQPIAAQSPTPYRPGSRQGGVLFVEDLGDLAFGTGVSPDPLWDATLTLHLGAGNYGWFGPTASMTEDGPDLATMQMYDLVIWNTFDCWWTPAALTSNDMTNIENYLSGGGKVWLIGQDLLYTGVPLGWMGTWFHLAGVIQDYAFPDPYMNVLGYSEISGLTCLFTPDYLSNEFYPDDLTPDGTAHDVLEDTDSTRTVGIFADDNTTAFWAVDGRQPSPQVNWDQMSYNMLDAFGIFGAPTVFWDFETGWQGWTHTSGQTFPAAWSVVTTTYPGGPYWTYVPPPDAGDSAFIIDSDAAGSGTWVLDTAMSPPVVNPGFNFCKWGFYLQYDDLQVLLREWDAGWGSWNVAASYSGTTGPQWDSADVTGYTGDSIQVAFQYDDGNSWLYGATFDNVGFYSPVAVDVGVTDIAAPTGNIFPSVAVDPEATYRNFGASQETFDCYFEIDSAGYNVYSQSASVTVDPGNDTVITWSSWTPGPNDGITYDVTTYTVLGGDVNPANDTMTTTATTQSAFWKIYSSSMPEGRYYHACVYMDDATPTVYSLAGSAGAGPTNAVFAFDCGSETWSTEPYTLNYSVDHNAAAVVGDKIYVLGGADAGFVAVNYNQEVDPAAGTVTDMAPLPTARYFLGAVTWNDTLIYVMGGQSTTYHNVVEIYDPATNGWTTGTPMPITNRSFGCGISGDTIYVVAGYSAGYIAQAYMGVIDPANPQTITWTAIANVPTGPSGSPGRSRLQGAGVDGKFYFTGGDDWGTAAYDTWYYDPADAMWHASLDKPTPISNTQCAVWAKQLDGGTFLCSGGYNTAAGTATAATEGLVNLGVAVQEIPDDVAFGTFGFASLANPVTDHSVISYTIPVSGRVSLKVYDGTGRLVTTLVDEVQLTGVKTVHWNTQTVSNGVYFLRLEANGEVATHKLIIVQ